MEYKIELIVKAKEGEDPVTWLEDEIGNIRPIGITRVYTSSIEPIDKYDPQYKFILDMENSHLWQSSS